MIVGRLILSNSDQSPILDQLHSKHSTKLLVLMPYNGNILVDGGSEIVRIACPGEPPLYADNNSKLPPHKRKKQPNSKNPKKLIPL